MDVSAASNDLVKYLTDNKGAVAAGTVGLAAGSVVGGIAGYAIGTPKKTSKKKRRKTAKKKVRRGKKRRRYTPHTAGQGKDRSTRRIRYTKNGQPYVILKSGKARFIKMSSAKRSHKRKGGRY